MDASSSSTPLGRRKRRSLRLLEKPRGPSGPGRVVERWLLVLALGDVGAGNPRPNAARAEVGRSPIASALVASQDALDDYELVDVAA